MYAEVSKILRLEGLHTFWVDELKENSNPLQILQKVKQDIWQDQVKRYQSRLEKMASLNKVTLQQFEEMIDLTTNESTRLKIFERKLQQSTGFSSFQELKLSTSGKIRSLAYATHEINELKTAMEEAYAAIYNLATNSGTIETYQTLVAKRIAAEADGKTLSEIDKIVEMAMTSGKTKEGKSTYKTLTSGVIKNFAKNNTVIETNFVAGGQGLSQTLNNTLNKLQGAIKILEAAEGMPNFNNGSLTSYLAYYMASMIDKSLGFALEGFEVNFLNDMDYIEQDRVNTEIQKIFKGATISRSAVSFGQENVSTGQENKKGKMQETTATADVIAKYRINKNGKGSLDVLIPISVKGYKLTGENKTKRAIHVLTSGKTRSIESIINSIMISERQKAMIYNVFGSRAGKTQKNKMAITYNQNALQNEVAEVNAIAAYSLLVDSLSGRASGTDMRNNAVVFDLNGKLFTISNLLQRLKPKTGDLSMIIDEESYVKRKTEIDPGLGKDEKSDELKAKRFENVRNMLVNAKANIALQNLGL